jgi:flagellar hook-basal body complex protein FliE
MFPLSAIPPFQPAQALGPGAELAPARVSPAADPAAPTGQPIDLTPTPPGESFGTLLGRLVGEVNSSQLAADQAMHSLQAGGHVSLHQAMIAIEEANVSFQLMVEVRNRLLDSYQEIMRMQI